MNTSITFSSKTSRFGLPFLFAGQAQKEFYLNETHALLDALLHPVVDGVANSPPLQPQEGSCWLVDTQPTDTWTGHASHIASFQAGSWLFAAPCEGMRIFDRSRGADMRFQNGWQIPAAVALPSGGSTVDVEARAAIASLVQALAEMGSIRQSP